MVEKRDAEIPVTPGSGNVLAERKSVLPLPRVTLLLIDCVATDLSRIAIEDTLSRIAPASTHVWSRRDQIITPSRGHCMLFSCDCRSLEEYGRILWHEAPSWIATSHILVEQYDGFVRDAGMWRDEFLDFDFVGAPWPWHPVLRVGNGGFSLRSTRLMLYLADHREEFPLIAGHPEDGLLCRQYRPALEARGFRWAPEELAREFSFEHEAPQASFGFHGLWHFVNVLDRPRLAERMALANDYVRSKIGWHELLLALERCS